MPGDVPEEGDVTVGPQGGGRLGEPDGRIHPVKGLRRDQEVELVGGQRPLFERNALDPELRVFPEKVPGGSGEVGSGLEAEHAMAALGEDDAGLARAAPNLHDLGGRGEVGSVQDLPDELAWIAGTNTVIGRGDIVEGGPQATVEESHLSCAGTSPPAGP